MWGRLGPRFAVEAGFLILVAVALGFAELRPLSIVIVMAAAWLLVSLIELIASRQSRYPVMAQRTTVATTEAPASPGPEQTAVGDATEETPAQEPAPGGGPGQHGDVREDGPDQGPRARRRWFRRREQPGEAQVEAAVVETGPVEEPGDGQPEARPAVASEAEDEPAGASRRRRWFRGRGDLGATPAAEPGSGEAPAPEPLTGESVGEQPAKTESSAQEDEIDAATESPRRGWLRRRERPADPLSERAPEAEPVSEDPLLDGPGADSDRVSDEVVTAERGGEEVRS
ncbi:MAG: hypothetical protein H0U03_07420 [Actinobacteria bacterium]|nr:hypothetical protein [Actinomycetota bacterium]